MIRYIFKFVASGEHFTFDVNPERNPTNFSHIKERAPWTELDFHKCPGCTLSIAHFPYCPIALDLQHAITTFRNVRSTDMLDVTAETPLRTVHKRCDFQSGFQSYMGLVMALSACPVLSKFRGAALYHLPFASLDETIIRNVGFYLLKQHFLQKNNAKADFELRGLAKIYDSVNVINLEFQDRLRKASDKDGSLNAIMSWWSTATLLTSMDAILAPYETMFVNKNPTPMSE